MTHINSINKEKAEPEIYLSLINTEKNTHLLKQFPHEEIADLSIVLKFNFWGLGSLFIDYNLLNSLGFSVEEAFEIGWKNLETDEFKLEPLFDFVKNNLAYEEEISYDTLFEKNTNKVYMITAKNVIEGSRAILSRKFMHMVSESTCCNRFLVLPSSRHELILINENDAFDIEIFREMVKEINIEHVLERDFLSDEVYLYDCADHTFKVYEC